MARFAVGVGTGVLMVRSLIGGAFGALVKTRADDQLVLRSADRITSR